MRFLGFWGIFGVLRCDIGVFGCFGYFWVFPGFNLRYWSFGLWVLPDFGFWDGLDLSFAFFDLRFLWCDFGVNGCWVGFELWYCL